MPGEIPYFVEGYVVKIADMINTAYVRVENGNVYHVFPFTPGIVFKDLTIDKKVLLEVGTRLDRVYSAKIIEKNSIAGECDGSTGVS